MVGDGKDSVSFTLYKRIGLERSSYPCTKDRGGQEVPENSRPLCILSHVRKLVDKAVLMHLERKFVTDKAQYGFQSRNR